MLLLSLHSMLRWLVLLSLLCSIGLAARGYFTKALFTPALNALRHWTATLAHIQLAIGMTLYIRNPLLREFSLFFRVIHISGMFTAVILLTIGSAMAKRAPLDQSRFRIMLIWYSLSLLIIIAVIPWPFSPFTGAARPLYRPITL